MKEWAEGFYTGTAWRNCRASFIARRISIDGGLCQRCRQRLGYIVHHMVELTPENITDADIALNQANLEYLCHECHNAEHDVFQPADRKVLFDADGNVIAVEDREKNFS